MDAVKTRKTLAEKLGYYRKRAGLTQAEVAEKINYSDKSVSKWERGDGLPDVLVLAALAEIYNISVGDFLSDEIPEELPEEVEQREELTSGLIRKNRVVITLLSVGLVWLVATLVFFALRIAVPDMPRAGIAFSAAIPVSLIVLVVFAGVWSGILLQCISVSALVWSIAAFLHSLVSRENIQLIYLVAFVMQVLVVLWFILKYKPGILHPKRPEEENDPAQQDENNM